nr:hypothetical protein [Candidatus Sigynarchaeum springense]MDO8118468.1 hypothetical protein [Candidatus Sigynarchaeota archaeon]
MKKLIRILGIRDVSDYLRLNFGPVVEEGLIIGVSIAALLILISVILTILDNTTNLLNDLTNGTIFG